VKDDSNKKPHAAPFAIQSYHISAMELDIKNLYSKTVPMEILRQLIQPRLSLNFLWKLIFHYNLKTSHDLLSQPPVCNAHVNATCTTAASTSNITSWIFFCAILQYIRPCWNFFKGQKESRIHSQEVYTPTDTYQKLWLPLKSFLCQKFNAKKIRPHNKVI